MHGKTTIKLELFLGAYVQSELLEGAFNVALGLTLFAFKKLPVHPSCNSLCYKLFKLLIYLFTPVRNNAKLLLAKELHPLAHQQYHINVTGSRHKTVATKLRLEMRNMSLS